MKWLASVLFFLLVFFSFAQEEDSEIEETITEVPSTMELGFDGYLGASNFGGSGGIGAKFGYKVNENFIMGPSFRVQRTWSNNIGQKFGYTIYGGGLWAHARFGNYLFAGAEFEMLKSPLNYIFISNQRTWVPTLFFGGGFSREFNKSVRVNAGVFYDIINNQNSPFRLSYFMKKANGTLIPVIYRIGFFFPIN